VEKQEAMVVLHDVLTECAGALLAHCVLLVPVAPKTLLNYDRFEVHIVCMVDDDLRHCVNTVVVKHKLALRQLGKVLVLYRPTS
jgi:hypothetical protein